LPSAATAGPAPAVAVFERHSDVSVSTLEGGGRPAFLEAPPPPPRGFLPDESPDTAAAEAEEVVVVVVVAVCAASGLSNPPPCNGCWGVHAALASRVP
jgi:hypothetical protein